MDAEQGISLATKPEREDIKMHRKACHISARALFALSMLWPLGPALAQSETITLRVADTFPVNHPVPTYGTKPWMEEITERSGGTIQFQYYPAGQIGKPAEMLARVQSSVVDIAYVAPAYITDKMPLSDVVQLPYLFATSCEGSAAYMDSARHGVIGKYDFERNGIVPLFGFVMPPYEIFTGDRQLTEVEDFAGLKLRTTGGIMDMVIEGLGAASIQMSAPEIYESLSRGTITGFVTPPSRVLAYDVQEFLQYGTDGGSFGSFAAPYVMSKKRWEALPQEARDVLTEVSQWIEPQMCAREDRNAPKAKEQLEEAGIEFIPVSPEFKEEIVAELSDVTKQWVEDMRSRGLPGEEVVKEFVQRVEAGRKNDRASIATGD